MQKQEQRQPFLLIEIIMTMYRNIFFNEEFLDLQNLPKNRNIVIQKSDNGHSVLIADKADYLDKMKNLLNDTRI